MIDSYTLSFLCVINVNVVVFLRVREQVQREKNAIMNSSKSIMTMFQ